MQQDDLYEELKAAGVAPGSLVRFDQVATPRHVRYMDLVGAYRDLSTSALPDAVIESAGQPYLYVVRRDRLGDPGHAPPRLGELIRVLACRSDGRFLAVVRPGRIDVYPVGIFAGIPPIALSSGSGANAAMLRGLLSGAVVGLESSKPRQSDPHNQWLEALLFRLLTEAAGGIRRATPALSVQQTIALVGRALFFRFLADRAIVIEEDVPLIAKGAIKLVDVFSTESNLLQVCTWMDRTFNGDLLSFGEEDRAILHSLAPHDLAEVCRHLTNIQYRAEGGQLPLDWGGILFRHVPVDVLSQVYEDFAHEFVPELARATSIHFTPRRLAEVVIDGAFSAVESAPAHKAKVLDPAVGGGVFLVLALRRLVAERWQTKAIRPTRSVIREILMTQLTGFDVNRDALNITALSLYLAALELDPKPSPLTDLKFHKLIGTVLHPVDPAALGHDSQDAEVGSLADAVIHQFQHRFDIVVGNPPWTGFKGKNKEALNRVLVRLMTDAETDRAGAGSAPRARLWFSGHCILAGGYTVGKAEGCARVRLAWANHVPAGVLRAAQTSLSFDACNGTDEFCSFAPRPPRMAHQFGSLRAFGRTQ